MENLKKFPEGFFNIVRPEVTPSKNKDDEIIPFVFPDNKNVKKGKYKNKIILKAVNKSNKK